MSNNIPLISHQQLEPARQPRLENKPRLENQPWLERRFFWKFTPAGVLLAILLLASAALHLVQINQIGDANAYYTAGVKSMVQSWHNFFFVAAEPGGSVTIDKPPLGFWVQALFGLVLGVNGFTMTLPSILAGLLSIGVLYAIVRRLSGALAGLIAALVMALTPVTLAVDRNNTIDSLLILTLLLAAWAFVRAAESGRLRDVLWGALWVGLGFNIKMLAALIPLPAFYALYFLGAKTPWMKKIFHLAAATALLLVVSLAWVVAVDLTPADQRPYVGSSANNSELNLLLGYNGVSRLMGRSFGINAAGGPVGNPPAAPDGGPGQPGQGSLPGDGSQGSPLDNNRRDGQNLFQNGGFGGGPGFGDTGNPGWLRFFSQPLGKEMSWLLPMALGLLALTLVSARPRAPLTDAGQRSFLLWGGWLLTGLVFFSLAGFFHSYYLALLTPALGGSIGAGSAVWGRTLKRWPWLAASGMLLLAGGTIWFQGWLAGQLGVETPVLAWPWFALAAGAAVLAVLAIAHLAWRGGALPGGLRVGLWGSFCAAAALAVLIIPFYWSVWTVEAPLTGLPGAFSGRTSFRGGGGFGPTGGRGDANEGLVSYLLAHAPQDGYLVAAPSAQVGASLVIETGRPVLYLGGFAGADPVIDAAGLEKLVKEGKLRYVLMGGMGGGMGLRGGANGTGGADGAGGANFPGGGFGNGEISVNQWVLQNCQAVKLDGATQGRMSNLYQCDGG